MLFARGDTAEDATVSGDRVSVSSNAGSVSQKETVSENGTVSGGSLPTPSGPTATEEPTESPWVTQTPSETETPAVTDPPFATDEPGEAPKTPLPTETEEPTETETPLPTKTEEPTDTKEGSETTSPTEPQKLTDTGTPTPTQSEKTEESGTPGPTATEKAGETESSSTNQKTPLPTQKGSGETARPTGKTPDPSAALPTTAPATSPRPSVTTSPAGGKKAQKKDTKPPVLYVYGVQDRSSSKKPVTVTVLVKEDNPSPDGIAAVLRGASQGDVPLKMTTKRDRAGTMYILGPIKRDDIYSLTISAADLAGNRTKGSIFFAVNTKGAAIKVLTPARKVVSEPFVPRIFIDDLEEVSITRASINGEERPYSFRGGVLAFSDEIREEGRYTIEVATVDAAGNENEESVTVTLSYKKRGILAAIRSFFTEKHETPGAESQTGAGPEASSAQSSRAVENAPAHSDSSSAQKAERTPSAVPGVGENVPSRKAEVTPAAPSVPSSKKKEQKKTIPWPGLLSISAVAFTVFAVFRRIARKS